MHRRRRVAEGLGEVRQHRLEHAAIDGRGRVVVEVDGRVRHRLDCSRSHDAMLLRSANAMIRRPVAYRRLSPAVLAALCSVPLGSGRRSRPKADAEFLRKAYDTYHDDAPGVAVPIEHLVVPRPHQHQRPRDRHRRRRPGRPAPHLRRLRDQRRLEDRRRRHDLAGDLRAHAVDEHRRPRRRAVEPRHRLGRHGRSEHLPRVDGRASASTSPPTPARPCSTWASPTRRPSRRIVVHPTNPDIVYVAASGHEWTDNEMRGVFKTTDGGKTWTKVLYKSPRTGAIDLVMDPRDPEHALRGAVAAHPPQVERPARRARLQRRRHHQDDRRRQDLDGRRARACRRRSSAAASASTSRDRSPTRSTRSSTTTRSAASAEARRSATPTAGRCPRARASSRAPTSIAPTTRGKTWRQTSRYDQATIDYLERTTRARTAGCSGRSASIRRTRTRIYILGVPLSVSTDGGKTFSADSRRACTAIITACGSIRPNPNIIYNANDGGFYQTADGGKTWTFAVSAAGAQFYNVELDTSSPFWAYGSIQDHGSRRGQVDISNGRGAIAAGGVRKRARRRRLATTRRSRATRTSSTRTASTATSAGRISAHRRRQAGRGRGRGGASTPIQPTDPDAELRAQWMAPFIISPHDGSIVYAGYQSRVPVARTAATAGKRSAAI